MLHTRVLLYIESGPFIFKRHLYVAKTQPYFSKFKHVRLKPDCLTVLSNATTQGEMINILAVVMGEDLELQIHTWFKSRNEGTPHRRGPPRGAPT